MRKSTLLAVYFVSMYGLAYGQEAPQQRPGGIVEIFLLFVVPFIVIFYFFFIRPQKKEQKKRREMLESVEKGDRITTIGGIMGRVVHLTDDTVTILIDEKQDVKMKLVKRAVASIKGKTEDIDNTEK